jgi:hypothetical protein
MSALRSSLLCLDAAARPIWTLSNLRTNRIFHDFSQIRQTVDLKGADLRFQVGKFFMPRFPAQKTGTQTGCAILWIPEAEATSILHPAVWKTNGV